MTGEEAKGGPDAGVPDNAKVVADNQHQHQQQQNGQEKAPVVNGTNMETLPRTGKQVRKPIINEE